MNPFARHMAYLLAAAMLMLPAWSATASEGEDIIRSLLPEPMAGFEWVTYRNCAFLKPSGWNQLARPDTPDAKTIGAVAVSPEKFSLDQPFEHGFTVQIAYDFKKTNGVDPAKGAMLMFKPIIDQHAKEDILLLDTKPSKIGATFVLRYRDAPAGQTPIVVHKFLVANTEADSLHIFTFESPEATWEENWKRYGTPILGRLAIIPSLPAQP